MSGALIALSGLPGVGKSTIARLLAWRIGGVILRIDIVDQALREIGVPVWRDESYRICYPLAEDNLRLGRIVIADCVNDVASTRQAWRDAAARAGSGCIDVELICSDAAEHRRRVETRSSQVPGLVLPTWADVAAITPEPWTGEHLVIDTARMRAETAAAQIETAFRAQRGA